MPKGNLNIGLDIGNFSLKAVILERVSGKIYLRQAMIVEKLQGIDREDISTSSFIVKALKDNIHFSQAYKPNLVFSLAGPYIRLKSISQLITTNKIDRTFDHAIWFRPDITEDVPFKKPVVDYWVLSNTIKKGTPVEVMAVCADEQLISNTVIALGDMGFTISGAEIDHTAIFRSVKYSGIVETEDKDFIFLDIGAKVSKIGIVKDDRLILVKDMMIGSNNLTTTLASNLNISLEEAEDKKKKTNFFPEDKQSISPEQESLIVAARPVIDKLIGEVERTLFLYKLSSKKDTPRKMLLLGGGARLKGLDRMLAKELNKDVEIFNPLKNIHFDESLVAGRNPQEIGHLLSVAIGLGLFLFEPKSVRSLNLIPVIFRPQRSKAFGLERLNPLTVLTSVFSILFAIYFGLLIYKFSLDRKLVSVGKDWNRLQQEAAEIKKINEAKSELAKKEEFVTKIASEQYLMSFLLKTLSELVPDGAWLVNVTLSGEMEEFAVEAEAKEEKKSLLDLDMLPSDDIFATKPKKPVVEKRSIKILVITGRSLFPGLVPQMMTSLKKVALFSDVTLKDFQEEEVTGKKIINFKISCKIRT